MIIINLIQVAKLKWRREPEEENLELHSKKKNG